MPELAEIYSALLDGAIRAVERSEQSHLLAQADALTKLDGKAPGVEDLKAAFALGWTPDYFVGAELQISAQLTMSTARERQVGGSGGVTFGPVQIQGSLAESFHQATETNLSVNCVLKRQSRSAGLDYALTALSAVAAPELPVPPGKAGG
jgi:hypothetical protein